MDGPTYKLVGALEQTAHDGTARLTRSTKNDDFHVDIGEGYRVERTPRFLTLSNTF